MEPFLFKMERSEVGKADQIKRGPDVERIDATGNSRCREL
ncbi:MAG: hypothetical protein Ct9H300mP19_15090 [Dehalococcoidia bacterium]|nr:MAG: hypothetical protein Ct9H300mP19_15090 [Dehalococcoidia bacterium]